MPTYMCIQHGLVSFSISKLKNKDRVICRDYIPNGCKNKMRKVNNAEHTLTDHLENRGPNVN